MSASDKAEAHMDKLKGTAKEAVGRVTGDDEQVAEGKMDQVKGDLKGAAEKVKDSVKDVFDRDSRDQ
ncbi:CsbD family protein [Leucobacter allii]|uniref:CsbD family protein n=1 Tax=Leucobacter allii TaxID=2932247 RepID=A0ABY4FLK4_9MICO|nr:CsbD family protein [Leucobacter allii]UOQ57139.1 CsbD family protein [Leucobacter allii]UOR01646.1 CsbD family protein [Leucobacter allii]